MKEILLLIAIAMSGYLLGSVSFAYILSTVALKRDIRKYGSGNAGTANMLRNFGWKLGIPTFLGDTLKGVLACYIGQVIGATFEHALLGACVGAVFAVIGHTYPVFLKFKGGKGIATTLGIILFLYPGVNIWVLVISLVIIAVFARVSAGSVVGIILAAIA
jgi:glycerol-3-phosphate acyltransferase PlsY